MKSLRSLSVMYPQLVMTELGCNWVCLAAGEPLPLPPSVSSPVAFGEVLRDSGNFPIPSCSSQNSMGQWLRSRTEWPLCAPSFDLQMPQGIPRALRNTYPDIPLPVHFLDPAPKQQASGPTWCVNIAWDFQSNHRALSQSPSPQRPPKAGS